MRDTIPCAVCGGRIGPHWQVFEHLRCGRPQPPRPDPRVLLATVELRRVTQTVQSLHGRWQASRRHRHQQHR